MGHVTIMLGLIHLLVIYGHWAYSFAEVKIDATVRMCSFYTQHFVHTVFVHKAYV